jgi:hypothetical protein
MKHLFGALTAVVLVCAPAAAYAQAGPAGNWELTMTTPQGTSTVTLALTLTGDRISGDLSSQMGSVPVTGTATGDDVALSADINIQGMALTFAMDGNVKVGDFGEFPFTGKRVTATAAAPAAPAAGPTTANAAAGAAAAAPITDLNGKWDIKLVIAGMGEMPATAVMKQDGDKISGTISGPAGELPIAGTVTGKSLRIDFEADTPQGKLPVTMTGDIGTTSVTGKATIAGMGEADWTATRAVQ